MARPAVHRWDGRPAFIEAETAGSAPHYIWDGRATDGTAVPDGVYRVTMWMADASNNRAAVGNLVTIDSARPELAATTTPATISPNGDRRFDVARLAMTANESVDGRARVLDAAGVAVRTWKFADLSAGNGSGTPTDDAGERVDDGVYTFRLDGIDAAGNGTVQQTPVLVDRTIVNITLGPPVVQAGADEKDRIELKLLRSATVSVLIYQGKTLVRRAIVDKPLTKGTWTWAWNGLNGHGELVEPGVYTATVIATSRVGVSRLTRTVTVKAP